MNRIIKKIRNIFANDKTYSDRSERRLMKNAPWAGYYDRTNIPKDLDGAITDEERLKNKNRLE